MNRSPAHLAELRGQLQRCHPAANPRCSGLTHIGDAAGQFRVESRATCRR